MDAFAELEIPRSPVVDGEAVARRFDELSRTRHPDAGGEAAIFARLTEARRLLATPAARLRHLLDLTAPGTRLDGALDPALMDIFGTLGPVLQAAEKFVLRKATATTALTRAMLAPEEMRHRESLESMAAALAERLDALSRAAASWDGTAASLAAMAREAAFLEKWQTQVRDHLSRLTP